MHPEVTEYCLQVKSKFPDFFKNKRVLDVGSMNINGTNRDLFQGCSYTGIDLAKADGVDIVSRAHEFKTDEPFDTIISTECFEHDKFLCSSLQNICKLLKPGGLFLFTCAGQGRAPHGIEESFPESSPNTNDHYENATVKMVVEAIDPEIEFVEFEFSKKNHDLRFYGIKRS